MRTNSCTRNRHRRACLMVTWAAAAASLMVTAGCGDKTEEAGDRAAGAPAAAGATAAPAGVGQDGQARQQYGQQVGDQAAANAAAFKAAKEKAEAEGRK